MWSDCLWWGGVGSHIPSSKHHVMDMHASWAFLWWATMDEQLLPALFGANGHVSYFGQLNVAKAKEGGEGASGAVWCGVVWGVW